MSTTFAQLGVAPELVASLAARGIDAPFPIQSATLPDSLAGRDVLGRGRTGSGKTTLLNVLSRFIPAVERIVTIEDSAELQLRQPHVVRLETRPPNIEGVGEVKQRELVINSLRMRPDRIILGEVRGAEALDMLQAMNTGHDGSITTGHANTPRDMLRRLETMVLFSGVEIPVKAIREQISSAIDILVHMSRLGNGRRAITSITEVTGISESQILLQEIFRRKGERGIGKEGELSPTDVPSKFLPPGEKGWA